jgi:PilZ domain-containing protein
MYAINLSWEQSNNTLLWAIEGGASLRITIRMANDWSEMPSDFLGGELLKSLVVRKFPAQWTDKMLAGQLLPCSFRQGHRKYLFVTSVLNSTTVKINGKNEEALVLAWPEGLQQVQRRMYFRAHIPPEMTLNAKIWPSMPAIDVAPKTTPIESGKLLNISAGGTQIELASSDILEMDKSYLMEIELPKPEEPVLVQAQARRVEAIPGFQSYHYGLQFLSLDHSPRGRETLLRLSRFTNYLRSLMPEHHPHHNE